MRFSRILSSTLLVAALFMLQACDLGGSGDGNGQLRIGLTDAPADFDEVNIEIRQVLVNRDQDDELDDGEEGEDEETLEENGWYPVLEDSITVNLLDYQNGAILELGAVELEEGNYEQIRLLLGENNSVVIDGTSYDLQTPSAQQSGYKLQINEAVQAGVIYDIVIDFDAGRSIVERGNGSYLLKPVLRTVELDETAGLSGTISPADGATWVYGIKQPEADSVSTQPDENGNFTLLGLQEGSYDLSVTAAEGYRDTLITDITIEVENVVLQDTIQLDTVSQ